MLARVAENLAGPLLEPPDLPAGEPGVLERAPVVMGEQLGEVGTVGRERLDPLGCQTVLVGSLGPRDLPVRHVADEDVPEGVLALARHRAAGLRPDELLPLQLA